MYNIALENCSQCLASQPRPHPLPVGVARYCLFKCAVQKARRREKWFQFAGRKQTRSVRNWPDNRKEEEERKEKKVCFGTQFLLSNNLTHDQTKKKHLRRAENQGKKARSVVYIGTVRSSRCVLCFSCPDPVRVFLVRVCICMCIKGGIKKHYASFPRPPKHPFFFLGNAVWENLLEKFGSYSVRDFQVLECALA